MSVSQRTAQNIRERLLQKADRQVLAGRLAGRLPASQPLPPRLPAANDHSEAGLLRRQEFLRKEGMILNALVGQTGRPAPESLANNIENLIGFAQVPVAVIGPLRINGTEAFGDFFVPMATHEAAMVASYHRGAYIISHAGGAAAVCLTDTVSRAPCFLFKSTLEACFFLDFAIE